MQVANGRDEIMALMIPMQEAKKVNTRQQIQFTMSGVQYVSTYSVAENGEIFFNLNAETRPLAKAMKTRYLISEEFNNLTPHELTQIILK